MSTKVVGGQRDNTIISIITALLGARGVGKARFQQSTSTHSRTGEKKAHNINVVDKSYTYIYI